MSDKEDKTQSQSQSLKPPASESRSSSRTTSPIRSPSPPRTSSPSNATPTTSVKISVPPTEEVRRTRANSPVGFSTELECKIRSQIGRVASLREIHDKLPFEPIEFMPLAETQHIIEHINEIHRTFLNEHAYLEVTWPAGNLEHEYLAQNYFEQEAELHYEIKSKVIRMRAQQVEANATYDQVAAPRLPSLDLPTFTSNYMEWPAFSELFKSIVIDNVSVTNIERLQYLKGHVKGEPLQLISSLPLTGDSFAPAWANLKRRYQNKRVLVQAQLDRLLSIFAISQRNASSINNMVSTLRDVSNALQSLGEPADLWNAILIHQVARNLDKSTREAWETKLGTAEEFPPIADLEAFLSSKARALESVEKSSGSSQSQISKNKPGGQRSSFAATTQSQTQARTGLQRYPCDCCGEEHFIVSCTKFRAMTVPSRRELIDRLSLCRKCCGRHATHNCKSAHRCKVCKEIHHTLMHLDKKPTARTQSQDAEAAPSTSQSHSSLGAVVNTPKQTQLNQRFNSCSNSTICDSNSSLITDYRYKRVLLATAVAQISSSTATHNVRLLIDAGSELTSVTEALVYNLGIQRTQSHIKINGIGGQHASQTRGIATLKVKSIYKNITIELHAHVLRTLTSMLPSFHMSQPHWSHIDKLTLADPHYYQQRPIDIIIGADYYGQIIKPNIIKSLPTMPIAQLSIFGWLIIGPTDKSQRESHFAYTTTTVESSNAVINELLSKFWVQEEIPSDSTNKITPEEQECEEHFQTTHSRDSNGRYIVRIPLKTSTSVLGNSYNTAHFCLQRTLNKLRKDDDYRKLYENFMQQYQVLNHMVKADSISPNDTSIFYLPHHGVPNPDSASTKLRVVFNGSSPSSSGHSINDLMHTGENLLLNISDVLLWTRHHKYIFATDITMMYRQIKVHQDDWKLQRILWVDDNGKETPFNLTTVTYGTKAAPYLAIRTLLQLAEDEGKNYPLALPSINHARYVDDIFGGADNHTDSVQIATQLIELCKADGFPLAKWHSNHPSLLEAVATQPIKNEMSLDDCNTKILGLRWNSVNDNFTFTTQTATHLKLSKRIILSEVAQIFDPLGFLSPVIIRAKMLLQELWLHKLNWDDSLPSQVTTQWTAIRKDLTGLNTISLPRWFNTYSNSTVELHGFSDASQLAMAAVVYITVISPSTNLRVTSLVCAKTKVAPLKKLTIPRLELTAALMLAKLMQYVQANLKLNVLNTYLWTDSRVTLNWIKSHASRWKDYVRN